MKLHEMLLAILIVGVIVYGTTYFITDLGTNYAKTVDLSSLNKTLEYTETTTENVDDLANTITDISISNPLEIVEVPFELIKAGWYATKLTFNQYGTISSITTDVSTGLNEQGITIPTWAIVMFTSFIIVLPVFMLVYGFFKWKFET